MPWQIIVKSLSTKTVSGAGVPLDKPETVTEEVYNQTVDNLDVKKVVAAVNGLKEESGRGY